MSPTLTTKEPYVKGPYCMVGGPFDGIGRPRGLETCWSITITEDGVTYYRYERQTPNDPRHYYKGSYQATKSSGPPGTP